MKYCFPLSFCPFVRLIHVGKEDGKRAIFLFFIPYIPISFPLFQAWIKVVFYTFMSCYLIPFEQRGERYRNKKAIIKSLNTDYFLQKFDF